MLKETIDELQIKFKINPNRAILQNFEFGANINTLKPVKSILRGMRAYQSSCFSQLKTEEIFDGKQLKKQESIYKVYDKGFILLENLLRIELAIKSTKLSRKYNIKVLADILNLENLNNIKPLLVDVWRDMIFYDRGAKLRQMTHQQRQKWFFLCDATNWETFTRAQRFKAKKSFRELKYKFCTSKTQEEILQLLIQKLEILSANNYTKNGNVLRNFSKNKSERFTHLDKDVKRYPDNDSENCKKNASKKAPVKRHKCIVCKTSITKKRAGAKYCSKRCNNRNNYLTQKKQKTNKKRYCKSI